MQRNARNAKPKMCSARSKRCCCARSLPVLDNLQRALTHQDSEGLRDGLAATERGFEAVLEAECVTPIRTIGEPFDPHVAEAIATQSTAEVPPDVVIAETQRGYLLDGEVLRPAHVIVAKSE